MDQGELRSGAEDNKLAKLDVVGAQLAAQFFQRLFDGRCFGDCMTTAFGGHGPSLKVVLHGGTADLCS